MESPPVLEGGLPLLSCHAPSFIVSPLSLLLLSALAAEPLSAVSEPPTDAAASPLFAGSLLEPKAASAGSASIGDSMLPTMEGDGSPGPSLAVCETPELSWLASAQSTYLGLLHDDGLALAGFYDPFSYQFAYGSAGAQPYRLGWYSYNDYVLMTNSPTSIGGNFQDQQWNAWMRYARLLQNSTVLTWTGWANGKFWAGPGAMDFPPGAAQFISDLQWASAWQGPWNWQVGVTPQLNGSFEGKINSNAFMADVRAVIFWRTSPQLLFVFGAAYWNRASDHLIPYGGVIWAPDDRWEFRAMFPRSRASYFLGRFRGADTWVYASGEYNIDAYQIDINGTSISVRGENSDYRVLLGASATTGIWTLFLEGGLVTDRHFRFRGDTPDFTMDDCGILRTGLLF
jgi:hypothetical protein